LIALAAIRDLDIIQSDITSAYLHSKLKEELYMEQPERYVTLARRTGCGGFGRVSTGWRRPRGHGMTS
jgi:hypothetical protein